MIVVTGSTGKKQLLKELYASTLASAGGESWTSELGSTAMHVKNKYFDLDITASIVPLDQAASLEDLLRDEKRVVGAIVVVDYRDRTNMIQWSDFSPKLAFRLLMCRTGSPDDDGKGTKVEKTQPWYDCCVANKFEFIDFPWRSDEDYKPRPGVEKFGLLGGELEGSERVLQVIQNTNYSAVKAFQEENRSMPTTRSGIRIGNETSENTILVIAVDTERAEGVFSRAFPDFRRKEKKESKEKRHDDLDDCSGVKINFTVDNKYYTMSAVARVVTNFCFHASMKDLLRLGRTYKAIFFVVSERDHLPQLAPAVEMCEMLAEEKYLVVDTSSMPTTPLIRQWGENNVTESIVVSADDKGAFFDKAEGAFGLCRLVEVVGVLPWEMKKATMKSAGSASRATPSAVNGSSGLPTEFPSNSIVFISIGAACDLEALLEAAGIAVPDSAQRSAFVKGVASASIRLSVTTKYYHASVTAYHTVVRNETEASIVGARCGCKPHGIVVVATHLEKDNSLLRQLFKELVGRLTDDDEASETTAGTVPSSATAIGALGSEKFTAVVSLSALPEELANPGESILPPSTEPTGDAEDDVMMPFLEVIDSTVDAARIKELLESTRWPYHAKVGANSTSEGNDEGSTTAAAQPHAGEDADEAALEAQADDQGAQGEKKKIRPFGCALPDHFFVHPVTLITERLDKLNFTELSARIQLMKTHGHNLPKSERKRQAAYLAAKLGDAVDLGEDITPPN